jgi:hypothetical protein
MTPVPHNQHGIIPLGGWIAATFVCVVGFFLLLALTLSNRLGLPELVLCVGIPLLVAGYVLVIAYIYGDARRRGMNALLWALLAFFAPSAIGIILYFILRDPLPVYCAKCGWPVYKGFPHCPNCGVNVTPVCPSCHRATQPPWTHCPWCGVKVA